MAARLSRRKFLKITGSGIVATAVSVAVQDCIAGDIPPMIPDKWKNIPHEWQSKVRVDKGGLQILQDAADKPVIAGQTWKDTGLTIDEYNWNALHRLDRIKQNPDPRYFINDHVGTDLKLWTVTLGPGMYVLSALVAPHDAPEDSFYPYAHADYKRLEHRFEVMVKDQITVDLTEVIGIPATEELDTPEFRASNIQIERLGRVRTEALRPDSYLSDFGQETVMGSEVHETKARTGAVVARYRGQRYG